MRIRLEHIRERLRTSFWFVPAIMVGAAMLLAFGAVNLDRMFQEHAEARWGWIYTGSPEGARGVLATIAASMITVAGVVFSITIVALSLASGQFGPRLLRNFIRDRKNQLVLGTFVATFTYCLLVLRTVRGSDSVEFVPGFAVALGIVLALTGLGVLIYFIHHVAISIQAPSVIASVTHELHATIDRLWPEELGAGLKSRSPRATELPADFEDKSVPIVVRSSGYIDAIDDSTILETARRHDLVLSLDLRPGHFVVAGSTVARAWPAERLHDDLRDSLGRLYILASQRTPFQDVEFAVDQLVEVAVRSLSPGVNDPFTAMTCIDRLGESLCRLAGRAIPSPHRCDDDGRLRVVTRPASFGDVADAAFNQIRQYGGSSAAVLIRLLERLATVARCLRRSDDCQAIGHHAVLVRRAADRNLAEESDREVVLQRFEAVLSILETVTSHRGRPSDADSDEAEIESGAPETSGSTSNSESDKSGSRHRRAP